MLPVLAHAHKLIRRLVLLAEYIQYMGDDELASVLSMVKRQRKKLKKWKVDESQYFCLVEPCGSPFCQACGVQMVNSVTGEEW